MPLLVLKRREIDENPHGAIAAPLLFTELGVMSIVILWRHVNTYCDVIKAFSCFRQVDYHSLIMNGQIQGVFTG